MYRMIFRDKLKEVINRCLGCMFFICVCEEGLKRRLKALSEEPEDDKINDR